MQTVCRMLYLIPLKSWRSFCHTQEWVGVPAILTSVQLLYTIANVVVEKKTILYYMYNVLTFLRIVKLW